MSKRHWRWFHIASTVFWIAMAPVSWITGWLSSVTYVSLISIWALVVSHFSAWRAEESGPEK